MFRIIDQEMVCLVGWLVGWLVCCCRRRQSSLRLVRWSGLWSKGKANEEEDDDDDDDEVIMRPSSQCVSFFPISNVCLSISFELAHLRENVAPIGRHTRSGGSVPHFDTINPRQKPKCVIKDSILFNNKPRSGFKLHLFLILQSTGCYHFFFFFNHPGWPFPRGWNNIRIQHIWNSVRVAHVR